MPLAGVRDRKTAIWVAWWVEEYELPNVNFHDLEQAITRGHLLDGHFDIDAYRASHQETMIHSGRL